MLGTGSVSVIVPIHNEQESIPLLYEALDRVLRRLSRRYEMIFVDDGSTDRSASLLRDLACRDAAAKVIEFRRNFGQTAAMSAGIELAAGEVIVFLDGDLQNDPEDISLLLEKIDEGYDLAHGWRRERKDPLLSRKLPSKIANWLISRVTRFPVNDLGCTLKAIRAEHAKDLQMYGEMHRFIPILAHWRGARCVQVVTRHHPRRYGKTKYGLWRTIRVLLDLVTVKFLVQYSSSPMRLFGGIGLISLLMAGTSLTAAIVMKLGWSFNMTGNPLLHLSVMAQLASIQFFALGLLGEMAIRTYHECQNKRPYRIRSLVNFENADPNDSHVLPSRAA